MIDTILTNGTPGDPSDDFDAIVVPNGNAAAGYADRAGYPVLTIPAGYGATASSAGHNPIGVTFVGTAFSEATLLAEAYAIEQAMNVRLAPSYTNPSMWRCVPGSTFFTGELCNPGDRLLQPTATETPTETATETPTETVTETPTPTVTPTALDTTTPSATDIATPAATDTAASTATATPTDTAVPTVTATPTPGKEKKPTHTPRPTNTDTPTKTPTKTDTPTNTATPTKTPKQHP